MQKRRQLTLFIEDHPSQTIEAIRKAFNPAQYALIKAHVTLCREDELEEMEKVMANLLQLNQAELTIDLGKVIRFADGKGVLLPAIGQNEQFHQLRAEILQGMIEKPRQHEPHITLMHPRNATCTDAIFAQIERTEFPSKITFRKISLIEQEMGKVWHVLKEFELCSKM